MLEQKIKIMYNISSKQTEDKLLLRIQIFRLNIDQTAWTRYTVLFHFSNSIMFDLQKQAILCEFMCGNKKPNIHKSRHNL